MPNMPFVMTKSYEELKRGLNTVIWKLINKHEVGDASGDVQDLPQDVKNLPEDIANLPQPRRAQAEFLNAAIGFIDNYNGSEKDKVEILSGLLLGIYKLIEFYYPNSSADNSYFHKMIPSILGVIWHTDVNFIAQDHVPDDKELALNKNSAYYLITPNALSPEKSQFYYYSYSSGKRILTPIAIDNPAIYIALSDIGKEAKANHLSLKAKEKIRDWTGHIQYNLIYEKYQARTEAKLLDSATATNMYHAANTFLDTVLQGSLHNTLESDHPLLKIEYHEPQGFFHSKEEKFTLKLLRKKLTELERIAHDQRQSEVHDLLDKDKQALDKDKQASKGGWFFSSSASSSSSSSSSAPAPKAAEQALPFAAIPGYPEGACESGYPKLNVPPGP